MWELHAYAGRDPLTGRKKYETKSVAAGGKREAQRLADEFAVSVRAGGKPSSTSTVGELLERWFAARAADLAPGTAYNARYRIDHYLAGLHDRPLAELDAEGLDDFYAALRARGGRDGKPLAASTVIRCHVDLRLALDQAVRWGLIRANPCDLARPARGKKKRVSVPDTEVVLRILEGAEARDPELLAYLFLDAETGARRAELAALRVNDFGLDDVTISRALSIALATPENARDYAGHYWPTATKRGELETALVEGDPKNEDSIRTLALSPATLELVAGQRKRVAERVALAGLDYPPDGFLFPAPGDGTRPLRPDTWSHRFIRLRDELGVAVRLHDLRHFVATTLLTSGIDLATVAGRMGHGGGGKTTLAIYAHFLKAPDRAASDVMAARLHKTEAADSNVVPIRASRRGGP